MKETNEQINIGIKVKEISKKWEAQERTGDAKERLFMVYLMTILAA